MTDPTPAPAAAPQPAAPLSESDDKLWASLAHFGGILFGFLPSLIIWLVLKDRGSTTNREAKEALNFQITLAIVFIAIFIVNGILTAVTLGLWAIIGWILPLAAWVLNVVFSIQGGLKVQQGGAYRYPVAVRFVK